MDIESNIPSFPLNCKAFIKSCGPNLAQCFYLIWLNVYMLFGESRQARLWHEHCLGEPEPVRRAALRAPPKEMNVEGDDSDAEI